MVSNGDPVRRATGPVPGPSLGHTGLIVAAVAAGAALRFWTSSHLWLDEALSVNIAGLDGPAAIHEALRHDGHPPLYYWLLWGWQQLVGTGDGAVRALSGALSLLTLPLFWLAGRDLAIPEDEQDPTAGRRLGWLAVAIAAANPYLVRYATEARMYALVSLLALAGWLLARAGLRRPRPAVLAALAGVVAALVLTHYWALWLVATALAGVGGLAWRHAEPAVRRNARMVLGAVVLGSAAFLPWLPTFVHQASRTATPWAEASRPTQVVALTLQDLGGGEEAEALLLTLLLGLLMLVGVLGRSTGAWLVEVDLRSRPDLRPLALVVAGTLGLGSVAAWVTATAFATRYAAPAVPFLLLAAAAGLAHLRPPGLGSAVLGVVVALSLAVTVHDAREERTQAATVAAAIRSGDPSGAPVGLRPVVVYCPDQLGPAVHRLLPADEFDQVIFPELELPEVDSPARIEWIDYQERHGDADPRQVAEALLARAGPSRAIWVVFSPSYRVVGEQCTELVVALGEQRGGAAVVIEDPERFFEHAGVQFYPPARGQ